MVTVGVLNALINIAVLIVIALVDRAVELILRNLASNRLSTHRRAPLVHDSDTWLPYLPRSVIKYHRHPAILLVVIFTILLVPAELVTELGIDVSSTCMPRRQTGPVIRPGDATDNYTTVELGGMAFFLQSTAFPDRPFTRVQAGFPRTITGRECIKCLNDKPSIIEGCHVQLERTYEPGQLEVAFQTTKGSFKTVTAWFKETKPNGISYHLRGDVTRNGQYWAATMFDRKPNTTKDVLYLEYTDQKHIDHLFRSTVQHKPNLILERTHSNVRMYSISCSTNHISRPRFIKALMVYRTIQLENPVKPASYEPQYNRFAEITEESVYISVLTLKIVDDDYDTGDFYRYSSCGKYNIIFLVPLFLCVCAIIVLGFMSLYFRSDPHIRRKIPYSSKSWLSHVKRKQKHDQIPAAPPTLRTHPTLSIDSITDEMILVEEGRGLFSGQTVSIQYPLADLESFEQSRDDIPPEMEPFEAYHSSYFPPPDIFPPR
ncbi:unnamed protein product [Agarophyton chilense]